MILKFKAKDGSPLLVIDLNEVSSIDCRGLILKIILNSGRVITIWKFRISDKIINQMVSAFKSRSTSTDADK